MYDGFIDGYELAQQSQSASIQQVFETVPYQCCPICNGTGKILADGCVSSLYQQCKVCNGAMIIPQYVIQKVLEQLNVSDGWIEINSKADLPTKRCYCWFWDKPTNKPISGKFLNDKKSTNFILANASHYMLISEPTPPQLK